MGVPGLAAVARLVKKPGRGFGHYRRPDALVSARCDCGKVKERQWKV